MASSLESAAPRAAHPGPDAWSIRTLPARDARLVWGIVALAFLVRLVPVLVGGGLHAVFTYDDGVYFGAADAWVNGLVPYRDALFLHPPGILYLLAPFAALGNVIGDGDALAVGRVAFMALGALNTFFVIAVAARLGRREALLAGCFYAVWPSAVVVERTTWLIAPQTAFLLVALLAVAYGGEGPHPAVGGRRAVVAGIAMGLTFSTQIWGAIPALVVLAWIVLAAGGTGMRARGRAAATYVVAATTTTIIAWAPFLLASGLPMLRYTFLDQLGRPEAAGSMVDRIRALEGLLDQANRLPARIPGWLVAAAFLGAVVIMAWAAWRRPGLRPWAVLAAIQLVVLALAPVYGHYAAWVAPACAILAGGAAATLSLRPGSGRPVRAALALATLGLLAASLVLSAARGTGTRLDLPALEVAVGSSRCVTADSPVLLVELDRLGRNVRERCPVVLDPSGNAYDLDRGDAAKRDVRPGYQAAMEAYYASGGAALFIRGADARLSAGTLAAIGAHLPVKTLVSGVTVMAAR